MAITEIRGAAAKLSLYLHIKRVLVWVQAVALVMRSTLLGVASINKTVGRQNYKSPTSDWLAGYFRSYLRKFAGLICVFVSDWCV